MTTSNEPGTIRADGGTEFGGPEATSAEIAAQLRHLGVVPGVLLVHTSFRATRPVAGGPCGLIRGLRDALGEGGTLVMPSWGGSDEAVFDPAATSAAADLGVVADAFWRLPEVRRSEHPFAFAAAGPDADRIVAGPLPLPPHAAESPVGRVYELDGQVLLLGVGHDANTTLHLAEVMAGVPYGVPKHCTVLRDGTPARVHYRENDHCCERFGLMDDWLRARGYQREGRVGRAMARLARARHIVAVALEELERDPLIFLHPPEAACGECDAARASIAETTMRVPQPEPHPTPNPDPSDPGRRRDPEPAAPPDPRPAPGPEPVRTPSPEPTPPSPRAGRGH
jgi:aminoglycoside N3'-acetyltransferase